MRTPDFLLTPTDNMLFNAFIALARVFRPKPKPTKRLLSAQEARVAMVVLMGLVGYYYCRDYARMRQPDLTPPPLKPTPEPEPKKEAPIVVPKHCNALVSYLGSTVKLAGKTIFRRGAIYRALIFDGNAQIYCGKTNAIVMTKNPNDYKITRILN